MDIGRLSLTDFRNYVRLELEPESGLNILVGLNAQGKSAILEAVYVLATSKSHRTSRDTDLIRIGRDSARVCAEVARTTQNDVELEVIFSKADKKAVKINKARHSKIGEIVGQLNAVIFSTSDIDMVKGEPSRRRRFLNLEISQVRPQYVHALGRYNRVLEQRNSFLREVGHGGGQTQELSAWDDQLALYGAAVMRRRAEFVGSLSTAAARIYASLSEGSEELMVSYKPSLEGAGEASEEDIRAQFLQALAARREVDVSRGITTVGPHRDDVALGVDGLGAREYGSQGQQRTAAIALKLAEIELMEESVGESPVVMLDDVMAELDENRRAQVFELTRGRCQTLLTTTHLSELPESVVREGCVFEVASGKVTRK